jgi:hypothetical protein
MGLTAPATVGPLELRPGGVQHVEHVRSSTPSLYRVVTFQSWPVIVEGTASGYNWWAASESATRGLNRLCALMTVSLGRAWIVRQNPGMVEGDALGAHYEGILIKDAHPSIALLALVSAIEVVGQKRLHIERCKCCRQVTENAERFRQALMLVVSEEEATALKRMAYGPRVQDRPCREAPRQGGDPWKSEPWQLLRHRTVLLVRDCHRAAA